MSKKGSQVIDPSCPEPNPRFIHANILIKDDYRTSGGQQIKVHMGNPDSTKTPLHFVSGQLMLYD